MYKILSNYNSKIGYCVFVSLFICACSIDNPPTNNPFCPNADVTLRSLIESGYEWIPEDVILIGKHFGDTLIYYQFDDNVDKSTPTHEFIKIRSDVPIDSLVLQSFLRNHNLRLLNKDYKIEEDYPLYVIHNKSMYIYVLRFSNSYNNEYSFIANVAFPHRCLL